MRNPYDRFLSFYFHSQIYNKSNIDNFLDILETFNLEHIRPGLDILNTGPKYLDPLIKEWEDILGLTIPTTCYVENDGGISKKINIYKMEDKDNWDIVSNNFLELFGKKLGQLPHINKSENRKEIILTSDQKERIYKIYEKDFINFNYKKDY